MKIALTGLAVAAALATAGALAAEQAGISKDPVTITGCLHAGQQPGSFVLTDVTDSKGVAAQVIYWLSSTKGLKDNVGKRISVTGPVVNVSQGEVEITNDPKDSPPAQVEIKARGKEVEAHTRSANVTTGAAEKTQTEEKRPVHRIKVQSVTAIAGTCP
jgi:hypothetical protein